MSDTDTPNRMPGTLPLILARAPYAGTARLLPARARSAAVAALCLSVLGLGRPPGMAAQELDQEAARRLEPELRAAVSQASDTARLPVLVEYEAPPPEPMPGLVPRLQQRASLALVGLNAVVAGDRGREVSVRERFWVVPAALVDATPRGVGEIASDPTVRRIYLDSRIPVVLEPLASAVAAPSFTSPAMTTIGADAVWETGVTGAGITVAFFDTGVDGLNAMLASRWRGNRTDTRASWFDPFVRASVPQDLVGHGTQVAAAAVGALPAGDTLTFPDGSRIVATSDIDVVTGPAPLAEWIAARVFERFGNEVYTRRSVLLQAFQWALDPDGSPATDDAPHVINNSWGIFAGTGGFDPCNDVLYEAIDAAEAAGIAVLFAAGNTGPQAGTIVPPAARDDPGLRSFGVGATAGTGTSIGVASFSGRGPSPCGGGVKPEIVAPGTVPEVRAAGPGAARLTGFTVQGTSFSTAQLSGAVALMRQLRPQAGPEEAKRLLLLSAIDLGVPGPDNDAGYGLLDVPAAVGRASPAIAGNLLQARLLRPADERPVLELRNRGERMWPGGSVSIELEGRRPVSRELPSLLPAGVTRLELDLDDSADRARAVHVTVLDHGGAIVLARSLYAGPPNLFGGYVLEAGELAAGGNDFGRFGRIAAATGFSWRGQELLPGASLLVASADRLSDGMYTTVLGREDLKSSAPAAETDWAPVRADTDVQPDRAEFRFDDFEALLPVGTEVAARAVATDAGGVGALTITASIRNLSGARLVDLVPGVFVDWDLAGGETTRWSSELEALVAEPLTGTGPIAVVAGDWSPVARTAVPLGTPGATGFYEPGTGVLVDEFEESLKLALVRGAPADGLAGFGTATDQAALLSVGPFDLPAGQTVSVRFWLLAADSQADAAARLAELRAEPVDPPGQVDEFVVEPPFPNPLRIGEGVMSFPYGVPEAAITKGSQLVFEVYDVAGRRLVRQRIRLSTGTPLPPVSWDGRLEGGQEAASGPYLYVFRLGDEVRSGRILIVR